MLTLMERMMEVVRNPAKQRMLLEDEETISGIVLALTEAPAEAVAVALDTLLHCADQPNGLNVLRKIFGLKESLILVNKNPEVDEKVREAAEKLRIRLENPGPLRQKQTSTDGFSVSGGASANAVSNLSTGVGGVRKRRVPMMALSSQSKALTFIVKTGAGLPAGEEEQKALKQRLIHVKGIISIYFQSRNSRLVLRCKMEMTGETIGEALGALDNLILEEVIGGGGGSEEYKQVAPPLRADPVKFEYDDKENVDPEEEKLEYLNESFGVSPKVDEEDAVVKTGLPPTQRTGRGWFSNVTNFIADNLYW